MSKIKEIGLIKQIEARDGAWFITFDGGAEYGPYKSALEMVRAWRQAIHDHYNPRNRSASL